MAGKFLIYGLIDPRTGELRYVGKSSQGMRRPRQHLHPGNFVKRRNHTAAWLRSLAKDELQPEIEILEDTDQEGLAAAEIYWISLSRFVGCALTNHAVGGAAGHAGCTHSAEVRRRIGDANRGKRPSEAARAKMAAAKIGKPGKPKSADAKLRIGAAHKGLKHSDEARKRMSDAHKGRSPSQNTREKLSQILRGRKRAPEVVAKIKATKARRKSELDTKGDKNVGSH